MSHLPVFRGHARTLAHASRVPMIFSALRRLTIDAGHRLDALHTEVAR
jgi:hypothetical protein